jgi:glycerol-3-phosphate acyltransferase PlsY
MTPLLQLCLAYLLGAIPFAYLAGRLKGLDIRQHGSGNVGATNVLRVLGKGPGAAVLALDMAKGALAVSVVPLVARADSFHAFLSDGPAEQAWWPCALGLAAVLGHSYTVFLRFKGGKGVATSAGAFLGLAPWATLTVLGVFLAVVLITRMVSAGSLAGAAALPPLVLAFKEWLPASARLSLDDLARGGWGPAARPVLWLACVLALLVWVKHIPNIQRILAGTEIRFGRGAGRAA